jgi:septal ring factor EnvC (AmiA/AmiB activator)
MINKDKSPNLEINNQELFEIVLELSKKINDIHRLHFSEPQLKKRKNQKEKFLAEILTSSARNSRKT